MISRIFSSLLLASALSAPALAQAEPHDGHDHAGHSHEAPEPVGEAPDHVFTVAPEDVVVGSDQAAHTLIVYASNTCPHCRTWFTEEWPAVDADMVKTGKLRLVYRPIPTQPTQLSMIGFMIASCAQDDGYFSSILHQYERQPAIFEKAQSGGLREEYAAIGRQAGLADDAALQACLSDADNLERIHLSSRRANHGRVAGIPSFVLDGEPIGSKETAQSLAKRLLDEAR